MYLEYDVDTDLVDIVFDTYAEGYIQTLSLEKLKELRDQITALLGDA